MAAIPARPRPERARTGRPAEPSTPSISAATDPKQLAVRVTPRVNNAADPDAGRDRARGCRGPDDQARGDPRPGRHRQQQQPRGPGAARSSGRRHGYGPCSRRRRAGCLARAYRGDAGQDDARIDSVFHLSQRASPAPGAATGADLVRDERRHRRDGSDPVAGPLHGQRREAHGRSQTRDRGSTTARRVPDAGHASSDSTRPIATHVADFAVLDSEARRRSRSNAFWAGHRERSSDRPACGSRRSRATAGQAVDARQRTGTKSVTCSPTATRPRRVRRSPPITVSTTPAHRGRVRVTLAHRADSTDERPGPAR